MVDDVAVDIRERRREQRRAGQRVEVEVRVDRIEELIAADRPGAWIAGGPLVRREVLDAATDLPVVIASADRHRFLRFGEGRHRAGAAGPEALVAAPLRAGEVVALRADVLAGAQRNRHRDDVPQHAGRRVVLVHVVAIRGGRPHEVELVQHTVREHPRVTDRMHVARNQVIELAERHVEAAAAAAEKLGVLVHVAVEQVLLRVHLVVAADELDVGERPAFERARQRGIELRGHIRHEEAVLARPLERAEVVQLVLDDRPAEGEPVLAALVPWVRTARIHLLLREDVVAVQLLVAEELECLAMQRVRTALGHDVHHTAGALTILRGHLRRVDRELANRRRGNVMTLFAALGDRIRQAVDEILRRAGRDAATDVGGVPFRTRGVQAGTGKKER